MVDIDSDTVITGTSIERATRSAVRCRVPVSLVGMLALGTRCTLARAMREASRARMMAPSIFASSDSRWGVNSASRRNPPLQMESTAASSPTTTRAPRWACRIRSRPSRRAVPGATSPNASMRRWSGWSTTAASYPGGPATPPRRTGSHVGEVGRLGGPDAAGRTLDRGQPLEERADPDQLERPATLGGCSRDEGAREPEPGGLVEAPLGRRHLAHLSGQSDLAEGHEVRRERATRRRRGHGEGEGEIGGRLGGPDPAGGRHEHLAPGEVETGAALEDGEQHGQPLGIEALDVAAGAGGAPVAHEGLNLDQQRPPALHEGGDRAAGHLRSPVAEQQGAGIGDLDEARLAHLEQPHLTG